MKFITLERKDCLIDRGIEHKHRREIRKGTVLHWYVVHSKPQKEQWLFNQFSALQIEAYYPRIHADIGKSETHKPKPYFPGYLFVNVDLELTGSSALQWLPGSFGLVAFGGEPAHVSNELLQSIRDHVDKINNERTQRSWDLQPGDEVLIHSGPFEGQEAIFCARLRDSERVQVLLKILQGQTIRVNLPVNHLKFTKHNRTLLKQ